MSSRFDRVILRRSPGPALRRGLLAAALLLPLPAVARTVVLVPLMSKGASDQQISNVTSLIESELDFMSDFDKVVAVTGNAGNTSCLGSTACLKGLAGKGSGDAVITGTLTATQTTFQLDLVYYDDASGRIVRRQSFEMSSRADQVADGMNAVVKELVTGKSKQDAQQAKEEDDFDFGGDAGGGSALLDDDFSFDEPDPAAERARLEAERQRQEQLRVAEERRRQEQQRAEEDRRRREAEDAARRVEEERRRREAEDAARRAEEESRRREAEDAARRAESERQRQASASKAPEFDPSAIQFGAPSPDDITFEQIQSIQFASPSNIQVERAETPPSRGSSSSSSSSSRARTPPPDDLESIELSDLDEEEDARAPVRSSPSSKPEAPPRKDPPKSNETTGAKGVKIVLRGGYTRYYTLNFLTYGGEVAVPLASGLHLQGGFEAYSTYRQIPPEQQEKFGGATAQWNSIFPISAGLTYRFGEGTVVPYLGADFLVAQYYATAATAEEPARSYLTMGGRAKVGADIWLSKVVGVELNGSIGAWHGERWIVIDEGIDNTGPLPQISGGFVFSF